MQRIHHTNNKEILIPYSIPYDKIEFQRIERKPIGLWYSIDWSWVDWCKENTGWTHNNHFLLEIDMNKILLIDSEEKLKSFSKIYGEVPPYMKELSNSKNPDIRKMAQTPRREYIDWKNVAKNYSGIEINPYQWKFRLDFDYSWYYGFDVSSGCIWDLSVIKSITKIKSKEHELKD